MGYPPPPSYPTHFLSTMSIPRPPSSRQLHPYLGPRARLSLSWLSQHFLALLLVLVALSFLLSSIPTLVREGKQTLTAACAGVEGAANVAVSLPHYMADGVNEMNAKTVSAVVNGAGTVLDLTLQAVEAIILFMIDTYRSLFLCLLDLVIHGSLTLLVSAVEEAQEFVSNALGTIRTDVQNAIEGINTGLDKTIGLIDKIPGVDIDVPTIDIPDLSALENVTIPSTVVDALTALNSSIPTLDEFRTQMNSLVSTPIELLRSNINSTMSNRTIEVELLPVPQKETVEICQGLDTTWIDDVGGELGKFVKIAMGLVVALMILFMIACWIWEKYNYRNFIGGVMSAREAWIRDLVDTSTSSVHPSNASEALSKPNLLSFINASSHPTLFSLLIRLQPLTPRLRSTNSKANLIWFFSYIANPNAWAFLALGLVGLLVVQVQLWALRGPVKDLTTKRANEGAGEFSNSVVGSLNSKMNESSWDFAEKSNRMILSVQDGINDDLFGWVNGTTEALNTTMHGFYDGITDSITDVFDGTVLEDPVLNLVYCLIGSKVDAISTALTWMHAHAHISLPTVSHNVLMLSPNRSQELTDGMTSPDSAVSTTSIVERMLKSYERSLEQQRLGFLIAIGIWGLVVVMGLIGLLWRSGGEEKWRRWRGQSNLGGGGGGAARYKDKDVDNEKFSPSFKPFHLRSESVNNQGRNSPSPPSPKSPAVNAAMIHHLAAYSFPPPSSPPPPGPLPPLPRLNEELPSSNSNTTTLQPSAASWASLVDFFKPTQEENDSRTPGPPRRLVEPNEQQLPLTKKRLLAIPTSVLPKLPRSFRSPGGTTTTTTSSRSRFEPKPFTISRPRPSSKQRRFSELVDLRTGEGYVTRRNVPVGKGSHEGGGGMRGIGRDLVSRVKHDSGKRRRDEGDNGWLELDDQDESNDPFSPQEHDPPLRMKKDTTKVIVQDNRFSFLPYLPPPSTQLACPYHPNDPTTTTANLNPFGDPSTKEIRNHRSISVQPPISPPPLTSQHPGTNPFADPLVKPTRTKEPHTSRTRSTSTNPFKTPFDHDDD